MYRYALIVVLLLPSILVGFFSVSDRGAAIFISPLLFVLPLTQAIMILTEFRVGFDAAIVASGTLWIGLGICSQFLYSRQPKKVVFSILASLGIINAAFIPWGVESLAWYA